MDFLYNGIKSRLALGDIDWENDDLRALLLDNAGSYTPDPDDDFVSDLGANELDTTNAARVALTGLSVVRDDTNARATLLASTVVFSDLADGEDPMPTVQALVIFLHNADDEAARLVAYCGSMTKTLTGETATFAWPGGVVAVIA